MRILGRILLGTAVLAGAVITGTPGFAHRVPACDIGPPTTAPQAPKSQGGDTVRAKNKHCEDNHATPGGPKK